MCSWANSFATCCWITILPFFSAAKYCKHRNLDINIHLCGGHGGQQCLTESLCNSSPVLIYHIATNTSWRAEAQPEHKVQFTWLATLLVTDSSTNVIWEVWSSGCHGIHIVDCGKGCTCISYTVVVWGGIPLMWLYTSSDLCSPCTNSLLMSYTQQQRCDPIHYLATHSLCAIVDDPCCDRVPSSLSLKMKKF